MRKRMDTKEPSKLRGGLRILSPDMPWLYVLSALVMTLLVEGLARRTPIGGFRFLARNPIGFWVNVGIILLTMLLAMLCPKRILRVRFHSQDSYTVYCLDGGGAAKGEMAGVDILGIAMVKP